MSIFTKHCEGGPLPFTMMFNGIKYRLVKSGYKSNSKRRHEFITTSARGCDQYNVEVTPASLHDRSKVNDG